MSRRALVLEVQRVVHVSKRASSALVGERRVELVGGSDQGLVLPHVQRQHA